MWEKGGVQARYSKLSRSRPYAVTPDAKRFLVWLWLTCERLDEKEPAKLFASSLEQLADECGVNVLQPAPPTEVKPPAMWKDIWGADLPNPFATGDLKGQTLVTQRDPELAKWLKAFATDPYGAKTAWTNAETKLLKGKALAYDADSHRVNVFVKPDASETDKAQFLKNAPAEVIEQCRREAKPIEFPGATTFNLTQQSKISTIPRLSALWDAMISQEREYVAHEKATLQQQRSEAEARLKALEAASSIPTPPRIAARARVGAE